VDITQIYPLSRKVSLLTGVPVQPNKAIVGENAFRHEAGIHQDGMLKEAATYEIIRPSTIGLKRGELVLGKLSGRHAFANRVQDLGFVLDETQLEGAFQAFKELADKKKTIYDEDLISLLEEKTSRIPSVYTLDYIHTVSGNRILPTATVRLRKGEEVLQEAACGDGPVDAAYRAIDRICRLPLVLVRYSLRAVTEGKDAQGEVIVRVESDGTLVTGRGVSTDVIEASASAYVNAINRLIHLREAAR
jgi:2-isopropylmalate synthase